MSVTINRPWTNTTRNSLQGPTYHTFTGTKADIATDNRPLPVKTVKDAMGWRPPTAYYRVTESGWLKCYDIQMNAVYNLVNGNPNGGQVSNVYAGADVAGGFYYAAPPAFPANLESQAIIKARLKLKSMNVNMAQAFAERHQVVRMCEDTLKNVKDIVEGIKRRKVPPNIKNALRNSWFFDQFLAERYGWEPLMSDLYGSVKQLHEREKERYQSGRVAVKAMVEAKDYAEDVIPWTLGTIHGEVHRERRTKHFGFIRLDFKQSDRPELQTLAQLGITNPLELAWELMPWSFVADWFVPVGDYLSSLDATLGWVFKGGSFSQMTRVRQRALSAKINWTGTQYQPQGYATCSGRGSQMQFARKVYSSAPLPSLPSLAKMDRSSHDHVANGIALLMGSITHGIKVR